jgi:pimeloyl-ACP methyl ester carboxylesterase
MKNEYKIFKKDKYEVEFKVFGHGEKKLLLFHGFGQDLYIVEMMSSLYNDYTIISTNLFYHSFDIIDDEFNELEQIVIEEFVSLFESLLNDVFIEEEFFSIMGYSIGGRLASVFVENSGLNIKELFLIAPDGYQFSFFYWFVTYTRIGLKAYNMVMKNIYEFKELARFLKNIKLLPANLYKFFIISIGLKRNRTIAPKVWLVYRSLVINQRLLKSKVNKANIDVKVFLGAYDPVIKLKHVKNRFSRFADEIIVINKGHKILSNSFFEKYFQKR